MYKIYYTILLLRNIGIHWIQRESSFILRRERENVPSLCVRARKLIDFWYTTELYASTAVPAYKYPQRPLLSIAPTTPEISIVIGKWTRRLVESES